MLSLVLQEGQLVLGGGEDDGGGDVAGVGGDGDVARSSGNAAAIADARAQHHEGVEHDAGQCKEGHAGELHASLGDVVRSKVKEKAKAEADQDVEDGPGEGGGHRDVAEPPLGHGEVAAEVADRVAPRDDGDPQDAVINACDGSHKGHDADELRRDEVDPQRRQDEAHEADGRETKGELRAELDHRGLARGREREGHRAQKDARGGGHAEPARVRQSADADAIEEDPEGQPDPAGHEERLEVHFAVHRRDSECPGQREGNLQYDHHLVWKALLLEKGPALVPHLVHERVEALVALVVELEEELLWRDHGLVVHRLVQHLRGVQQWQVGTPFQILQRRHGTT
mmetsp:Transcript_9112/g.23338  ORF Transcript_9112/g.23338 Transcript_9112/m.23338 type:complete len:341 (+) Transcript_9112:47-1069(+)